MRFDSGFWSKETIATLGRLDVRYTILLRDCQACAHSVPTERRPRHAQVPLPARRLDGMAAQNAVAGDQSSADSDGECGSAPARLRHLPRAR